MIKKLLTFFEKLYISMKKTSIKSAQDLGDRTEVLRQNCPLSTDQ